MTHVGRRSLPGKMSGIVRELDVFWAVGTVLIPFTWLVNVVKVIARKSHSVQSTSLVGEGAPCGRIGGRVAAVSKGNGKKRSRKDDESFAGIHFRIFSPGSVVSRLYRRWAQLWEEAERSAAGLGNDKGAAEAERATRRVMAILTKWC